MDVEPEEVKREISKIATVGKEEPDVMEKSGSCRKHQKKTSWVGRLKLAGVYLDPQCDSEKPPSQIGVFFNCFLKPSFFSEKLILPSIVLLTSITYALVSFYFYAHD